MAKARMKDMSEIVLYLKSGYTIFNEADFDKISQYTWHKNNKGYIVHHKRDKKNKYVGCIFMHRLILGLTDKKDLCDHKNHLPYDNRRCNIRKATHLENARNSKARGECKYLGVTYQTCRFVSKKTGKPMVYRYIKAKINYGGRVLHIGTFDTEEEAALAYNEAAKKYYGEFANLNVL